MRSLLAGTATDTQIEAPLAPRLVNDHRVVLTLDAGGTNFVFSAMRGGREVAEPVTLPSRAHDLSLCLSVIVDGFEHVRDQAGTPPAAISFAFPGPADYPSGIVGNAHNLPAFRDPVALGPMLASHFKIPVYIHNDGDLFAYGEAIAGFLPYVNGLMADAGRRRRFRHLFGATLGTGFGGGIVLDGRLHAGDNAAAGEVWAIRHKLDRDHACEDGVSIRAVREEYARRAGLDPAAAPEPRAVYEIAMGHLPGDVAAARESFRRLGEVLGDALVSVVALLDTPIVIGGGLSGAASLFVPAVVAEMNGRIRCAGSEVPRTDIRAFDLDDPADRERFLGDAVRELEVPVAGGRVAYDPLKRIAVGLSRLGTSRAVAVGAYAFALDALDSSPPRH